MSEPKRIQRKRIQGWRMPENVVYVGRPTRWGNPFAIVPGLINTVHDTRFSNDVHSPEWSCQAGEARGVAVRLFREYLMDGRLDIDPDDVADELAGKDLACWCPLDQPCHADVLLELANQETP